MLKKFTKEVKKELEDVLNELKSVDESLETLIPELVRKFHSFYDNFIRDVGTEIQDEIKRKLSPQSQESEFWNALIAEKGRMREPGETFKGNVIQTFRRQLELEPNLGSAEKVRNQQDWG